MTIFSLDDIDEIGEYLASIDERFTPMEADMLDGFLTALCLMKKPPRIDTWLPYVYDIEGNATPSDASSALRQLILKRGKALEETILAGKPIDPIVYDEGEGETDFTVLSPFADGFAFASSLWPELLETKSKPVQAALIGILRYQTKDEEDTVTRSVLEEINTSVRFASIDEAIADIAACVNEIAEITRPRSAA